MRYLVLAGGDQDVPGDRSRYGPFDMTVCANGGTHLALRLGLRPDIVIGDLDSLQPDLHSRLEAGGTRFITHPTAKDETDLELALLWCLGQGARDVVVLGAWGSRPDHSLGNIFLLTDPRLEKARITFVSSTWQMFVARAEADVRGQAGDTVSLIPLTARVDNIRTEGLAYPLRGETLWRGPARGVSNVMLGATARITLASGILLVLHGPSQPALEDG